MVESQTNIVIGQPKANDAASPVSQAPQMIPQMSGEGYKLIDRLVDPTAIYLDKLTTYTYCAHLIKSPVFDPESPFPGYKLLKVGGNKWKPNMNLLGYTTLTSEILMALSEDGSVTRFPDDFLFQLFCARQTMAIIGMLIANKKDWEFSNYTMIYSFGLTLFKAQIAVLSRSRAQEGKRTLMDMLVHPNLWFSQGQGMDNPPQKKWLL